MVKEFILNAEGIDRATLEVEAFLSGVGVDTREAIAGRLAFENALLEYRDAFGEGTPATLKVSRLLGRPRLVLTVHGPKHDPFSSLNEFEHGRMYANRLLEVSELRPIYDYRGDTNIIALIRPQKPLSTMAKILVALLCGLLVSLLGKVLLSDATREYALNRFVMPLFNVYLGMLSGIAGPLVFLSVAWGVCGIGDVSALGRSGKAMLLKFMRDNVLAVAIAIVVCIPVFSLPFSAGSGASDLVANILDLFLKLLPTNVFAPFVEGNTSQIIVLGLFVGIAALVLGSAFSRGRMALQELNSLVQFLMEQLCRLIPLFIFIMVISQVWSGAFRSLLSSWKPLLLSIALIVAVSGLHVLAVNARCKTPIGELIKALKPGVLLALSTASSPAAFGTMVSTCTDDLGVDKELTSFGVPLGIIACQPSTSIMIVVIMMYCMSVNGLGADASWYLRLALCSLLYAMVAPPVPGGMLVCYSLMFAELGIPDTSLVLVTAIDVILDYFVTGTRVGSIMLGVFEVGHSLGVVREKERKSA